MAPKKQTTTSTRTLRPRKSTEQAPRPARPGSVRRTASGSLEVILGNQSPPRRRDYIRDSGDSLAVNFGGVAYTKPSKVAKKPAAKKPALKKPKPARLPKNNRSSADSTEAIAGSPPPPSPESPIMKKIKLRGKAKERAENILGGIRLLRDAVHDENVLRVDDFYDEIEEVLTLAAYDFGTAVLNGVRVVVEQPEEEEEEEESGDNGATIYCY